jgi:hypothetical protein
MDGRANQCYCLCYLGVSCSELDLPLELPQGRLMGLNLVSHLMYFCCKSGKVVVLIVLLRCWASRRLLILRLSIVLVVVCTHNYNETLMLFSEAIEQVPGRRVYKVRRVYDMV